MPSTAILNEWNIAFFFCNQEMAQTGFSTDLTCLSQEFIATLMQKFSFPPEKLVS